MSTLAPLFLKLQNLKKNVAINGDSVYEFRSSSGARSFKDSIELISFSWDLDKEPGSFKFSKSIDCASTAMLSAAMARDSLKAEIFLLEDSDDSAFEIKITLLDVNIVSYDLTGASLEKNIKEDWTFTYSSIDFSYEGRAAKGAVNYKMARRKDWSEDGSSKKDSNGKTETETPEEWQAPAESMSRSTSGSMPSLRRQEFGGI
jgi:type VI protein secretion system component Hcp